MDQTLEEVVMARWAYDRAEEESMRSPSQQV
jgi:hypothetical protein